MAFKHFFWAKLFKKLPALIFDLVSIPLAWYLAYWLRFNMKPFPLEMINRASLSALLCLMVVQMLAYYHCKVYRGLWRFFSINDVERIIKAVVIAIVAVIPILYVLSLLHFIPRSVFPLYALLIITLLCGARLLRRSYYGHRPVQKGTPRVLVVGAGEAGEGLVRDLKRSSHYLPLGFVDDNLSKLGMEIHGVPVLGAIEEIASLVSAYQVNIILIAIPSARSAQMRRIVGFCEPCQIPCQTLPSLNELTSGRIEINALRQVNLEDLLGRDEVVLEWHKIAEEIEGNKVIVTGGGGSIGSELCRQIMSLKPKALLIIDNSEYNLYKIGEELKTTYPDHSLQLQLHSVTDASAIRHCFAEFQPQIVFHAAAFKHVPMLEHQIRGAILNNVLGTEIVAKASIASGVKKFILISTDKAVNPTNIMGATKRAGELYCQNLNEQGNTQFITVRFGNVLGSAGSVIPLFKKQLQKGGPLTVTHPDIERYFMTIPEACQLILQAMSNGEGGEIFVLDMGEPIKISYLAEQMIRLAGKEPGKDIEIVFTGLRPGEKLYEELFHEAEQLQATNHAKLLKASFRQLDWVFLEKSMQQLGLACEDYTPEILYTILKQLVPEFTA